MVGQDLLGSLLMIGVPVLIFLALSGLVLYLLQAIGLYKMALNLGIEYGWLAFIPVLNLYIIGKITGQVEVGDYKITSIEFIYPLSWIIAVMLNEVPLFGSIISVAFYVFSILVMYTLYKSYRAKSAAMYTLVSAVLPFMIPVYIFMLKDRTHARKLYDDTNISINH